MTQVGDRVPFAHSIDIFCRVVDNYGDIGVCWRLAKALATLVGDGRVRLWVDNQDVFARIEPAVQPRRRQQTIGGVDIVHWGPEATGLTPRNIVIEAFGCNPPQDFIARMKRQRHVWINLEYLSAEAWVERCHALPSRQPDGTVKTFFFPGFTTATGGLLREQGLLDMRDDWLADADARKRLLKSIGLPDTQIQRLHDGARQVVLFCYPQAPAQALVDVLGRQPEPSILLVPEGVFPSLRTSSSPPSKGRVYIHEMAFVDQPNFDRLLWSSDLNLVRGEDSLVRALWAARPLLWHIYPQTQRAHMDKLDAWLGRSPYSALTKHTMRAWNTGNVSELSQGLDQLLAPAPFSRWKAAARKWARDLSGQRELAHEILAYCAEEWQTR